MKFVIKIPNDKNAENNASQILKRLAKQVKVDGVINFGVTVKE